MSTCIMSRTLSSSGLSRPLSSRPSLRPSSHRSVSINRESPRTSGIAVTDSSNCSFSRPDVKPPHRLPPAQRIRHGSRIVRDASPIALALRHANHAYLQASSPKTRLIDTLPTCATGAKRCCEPHRKLSRPSSYLKQCVGTSATAYSSTIQASVTGFSAKRIAQRMAPYHAHQESHKQTRSYRPPTTKRPQQAPAQRVRRRRHARHFGRKGEL